MGHVAATFDFAKIFRGGRKLKYSLESNFLIFDLSFQASSQEGKRGNYVPNTSKL